MDKQQLVEKTEQTLKPFETGNLIDTIQTISMAQLFDHPLLLISLLALLVFGVVRRSKLILLSMFSLCGLTLMVRYALPADGKELTLSSILPFLGFGLVIGGVIIYFTMIKD